MEVNQSKYSKLIKGLEDLTKSLNEIDQEIMKLYKETKDANKDLHSTDYLYKKFHLYDLKESINEKMNSVRRELFWESPPLKTNDQIELRKHIDGRNDNQNDVTGQYSICLSGKRMVIGYIGYNCYHYDDFYGDVSYTIDEEFQGHNYAYQALCLLGELMKEHGIDDFWISAYKDNLPSTKIIEKYGGIPIKEGKDYTLYEAKTFINQKAYQEDTISK